eukprot:10433158-Prorocentrum_lima.AAC.1
MQNPQRSELFELPAWTKVEQHPRLVWTYCHMCAAGLKDQKTNVYLKKATEIWASDERQLRCIRPL